MSFFFTETTKKKVLTPCSNEWLFCNIPSWRNVDFFSFLWMEQEVSSHGEHSFCLITHLLHIHCQLCKGISDKKYVSAPAKLTNSRWCRYIERAHWRIQSGDDIENSNLAIFNLTVRILHQKVNFAGLVRPPKNRPHLFLNLGWLKLRALSNALAAFS